MSSLYTHDRSRRQRHGAWVGFADKLLGQHTAPPRCGAPYEKRTIQTWPPAPQPLKAWARALELGGYPRNIPKTQLPAKAERPVFPKPLLLSLVVFRMDSQLKPILSPRLCGLWGHNPSAHVYPNTKSGGAGGGGAGAPNLAEPPSKTYIHQMGC